MFKIFEILKMLEKCTSNLRKYSKSLKTKIFTTKMKIS